MKNKDMPAMPVTMTHSKDGGLTKTDKFEGLTKREMFAMNAPFIDIEFEIKFARDNISDKCLVSAFSALSNGSDGFKLTLKGKMQAMKEWSYAYADLMLGDE